jgi:DNA-binding transcriptional regulator YiaG
MTAESKVWDAESVRVLRARLNLTQREAAAWVGVSHATWSLWENGRTVSAPFQILLGLLDAGRLDSPRNGK